MFHRIFHSGFTNSYCYRKLIYISFLFLPVTLIACEDRTPLGLRNGLIRDDQISASSTYQDKRELQPNFARLGSSYQWCSGGNKSAEEEYLQVFSIYYPANAFSRRAMYRCKKSSRGFRRKI